MKIRISQKGFDRIRSGHPWVFRSDIQEATPDPSFEYGQVVSVETSTGRPVGQGFYNPKSQISLRFLTRAKDPIDGSFIRRRIREAIARRPFLAPKTARRLVYGEADLLPSLIIDIYDRVVVLQILSAGMDRFKEDIFREIQDTLSPSAIVERNDPSVRELEGLDRRKGILFGNVPGPIEINEGGFLFEADPLEGQKTGMFLDQADNHLQARHYARGRTLDLFSYQGGFALSVSKTAEEILAVDSSEPALEILKRNLSHNGIQNVTPILANGFDYLREAHERREMFNTVILDPPPFVKDRKNLTGGIRGYKEINLRAMKLLKPGGILITCSCSQNFTPKLFEEMLQEASRDTDQAVQILEKRGATADHPVLLSFPESAYLQCWIVRVL